MNALDRLCCHVSLADADGGLHGCGVICGTRHALTCAHVIVDCLGSAVEGDEVDVRFRIDLEHKARMIVRKIYAERPPIGASGDDRHRRDICLLELCPDSAFPIKFRAAQPSACSLSDSLPFRALGLGAFELNTAEQANSTYRPTVIHTVELVGETGEYSELNRVFLRGKSKDQAVRPGCSGAGVFSGTSGLIGMVAEEQQRQMGFMIPVAVLKEVWDFGQETAPSAVSSPTAAAKAPLNQLFDERLPQFDRVDQVAQFNRHFETNWQDARRGFICTIAGMDDDMPLQCRDRIRAHLARFFNEHGFSTKPPPRAISWPEKELFNVAEHLANLKSRLQYYAETYKSDIGSIRDGLDKQPAPGIFYSVIDQRVWGKRHVQLLRQWSDWLAQLNAEPLEKPFLHLLIIKLDKDIAGGDDIARSRRFDRFYRELHVETNRGADVRRVESTDRLDGFPLDIVETWIEEVGATLDLDILALKRNATVFFPEGRFRLERVKNWIKQLA